MNEKLFENLWRVGELVTDDLTNPEKLYLVEDNIPYAKYSFCECGKTQYKIRTQVLYELEGVQLQKVAEREIKEEIKKDG